MIKNQMRVLTSRWVLPIDSAPISGGWIRLNGDAVVELGSEEIPAGATDLGDVAILPGLVNAHTHLEFASLRNPIGTPGMGLENWIGEVIASRASTSAADRQSAIFQGLNESHAAGVRLVAEITSPPIDYPTSDLMTDVISFSEVLGLKHGRASERFAAAMTHADRFKHAAISPHAPYSTNPETIDQCIAWSKRNHRPLAMHVAESPSERELLVNGTGPMADSLDRLGVFDDSYFPRGNDPFVELISKLSDCNLGLIIHANDLKPLEIDELAKHENLSVVLCPRTHDFFCFDKHPVASMLAAGIRVALGTDSRASNPDLNLWNEVQYLLAHRPDMNPRSVLEMATIHGANAVGRNDLGRIAIGASPGLITIETDAGTLDDLYQDFAENSAKPIWKI